MTRELRACQMAMASPCIKVNNSFQVEEEYDDDGDGIQCAGRIGFDSSWGFLDDWFGYFRFHCFYSVLSCILEQYQGRLLILESSIKGFSPEDSIIKMVFVVLQAASTLNLNTIHEVVTKSRPVR
ncbi:hypothetical protein L6164_026970 [Bauhinia variegata]|uniref:Uncharacterized protein n=1 Tax=Bauhinia variegata TaxID=167791 RepID=A0ACB9LRJ4_BAUVA|nr:hypothetical protein L6164_026970 [Bauhinia variegata]